jgi:3-hydroxyacyl-[acyl-carrier-protein] dehydratase
MSGAANSTHPFTERDEALGLLPHRAPFRFVTRLTTFEPGVRAHGVWQVKGDEDFLKGHFPGNPIVPGVLIGEALAQVSGMVSTPADNRRQAIEGRLAQIDLRFLEVVVPPAEIVLKAELTRSLNQLHLFAVEAILDGQIVARGSLTLALAVGEMR